MKLDVTVNAVLNDIMAGENAAVLLYAPSEYDKEDFLGELGTRYYKSYWFNAVVHDLQQPAICLIDGLLDGEPELRMRLKQLLFCNSRYNGPDVALSAVLEYLAKSKREIIIVFEKMDMLPDGYDYSKYVYLIKHAPSNVKIVLSSDKFLSMEVNSFEPNCPMLIDENSLLKCADLCAPSEYVKDLNAKDIAFLRYVSEYGVVSDKTAERISRGSTRMLDILARKGIYVAARDSGTGGKYYCFKKEFSEYLKAIEAPSEFDGYYAGKDLGGEIFESLCAEGKYFIALRHAVRDKRFDRIEKAGSLAINTDEIVNIINFIGSHPELGIEEEVDVEKYPYTALLRTAHIAKHGRLFARTLTELPRIQERLLELEDGVRAYLCAVYVELNCFIKLGATDKVRDRIGELNERYAGNEEIEGYLTILRNLLPDFLNNADVSVTTLEQTLAAPGADRHFWYLKLYEDLELYYYHVGNYRQSMDTARKIKAVCPGYVIPLRVIAMNYFEGDIEETTRLLEEALDFAITNNLFADTHMLYSVKALVAAYHGKAEEVKYYCDKAYSLITKEDNFEKFFTIYVRCYTKASSGEVSYARNLAQIYLKYARERAPEYVEMMLQSYAYALFRSGDGERAYKAATQAINAAKHKSFIWLFSMGLATNWLLVKGELKDVESLVGNILRYSENYGMRMVPVDTAGDIFEPILRYAREHGIEPETVERIDALVAGRRGAKQEGAVIKVNMFGDVSITVGGKELQWKTRKSKELFLHYLVAGDIGIDRNVIIDFLWKDYLYESAINNLKTTNNIIRKTLQAYNVDFRLDYLNSRYSLKVYNISSDLNTYRELAEKFAREDDVTHKAEIMSDILKIYKSDFALDMNYADFEHERTSIKQEMILNLMKLIRALAKERKYIEAKEFLSSLVLIDKSNDYGHMVAELDRFINLT